MVEIDKKIINAFDDILNLRGLSIDNSPPGADYFDFVSLDRRKKDHIKTYQHDGDCWMFPYIFAEGIEEGWLKIEIDETNPKNKLRYINKLLKMYDKGE